jgi:hypothetical protein
VVAAAELFNESESEFFWVCWPIRLDGFAGAVDLFPLVATCSWKRPAAAAPGFWLA